MSRGGKVTACGIEITVRPADASHVSLHGFHISRERRNLWDQSETAGAMAELLGAGTCRCVEAVHERQSNTNDFGYGFLILPQTLPTAAVDLFGGSELRIPRIVVIVNDAVRGQGVGKEITRQLLDLARSCGCEVVQVEADAEQREFFVRHVEFEPVPNGVRQHRLGELTLLQRALS